MNRTSLLAFALIPLFAAPSLFAQAAPRTAPPGSPASVPILLPEGYTDSNGWSFPGTVWKHVTPESEGFSPARLDVLRAFLKTHQTDGMMIVSRGHVVFEYGDTALVSKVASVRKSVLDLMFAVEQKRHGLNLDEAMQKTVVQLGLEEKRAPFLEPEQHATLEQLMMTRSGIYISDGNGDQDKILPKRGSFYPGTHWFYNNWDFDAAGLAFESLTHKDLFAAMRDDLAIPLRFQDFDLARQKKNMIPDSKHFEYATYLSTRDMARLGLLAISHGLWGNTQWGEGGIIDYSVYPTTRFEEMEPHYSPPGFTGHWGYGMLWWVWDPPRYPGNTIMGPWQGAFSAMGAGGQYITAFPSKDLVVVHKVNTDQDDQRNISGATWMTILELVMDSKCDQQCN